MNRRNVETGGSNEEEAAEAVVPESSVEKLTKIREKTVADREAVAVARKTKKRALAKEVVDMTEGNKRLNAHVEHARKKPGFKDGRAESISKVGSKMHVLIREAYKLTERAEEIRKNIAETEKDVPQSAERDELITSAVAEAEELERAAAQKISESDKIEGTVTEMVKEKSRVEDEQWKISEKPEEFALEQVANANDIPVSERGELKKDVEDEKRAKVEQQWANEAHSSLDAFEVECKNVFDNAKKEIQGLVETLDLEGPEGQKLSQQIAEARDAFDAYIGIKTKGFVFGRAGKESKALEKSKEADTFVLRRVIGDRTGSIKERIWVDKQNFIIFVGNLDNRKLFSGPGTDSYLNPSADNAYITDHVGTKPSGGSYRLSETFKDEGLAKTIEDERMDTITKAGLQRLEIERLVEEAGRKIEEIKREFERKS